MKILREERGEGGKKESKEKRSDDGRNLKLGELKMKKEEGDERWRVRMCAIKKKKRGASRDRGQTRAESRCQDGVWLDRIRSRGFLVVRMNRGRGQSHETVAVSAGRSFDTLYLLLLCLSR